MLKLFCTISNPAEKLHGVREGCVITSIDESKTVVTYKQYAEEEGMVNGYRAETLVLDDETEPIRIISADTNLIDVYVIYQRMNENLYYYRINKKPARQLKKSSAPTQIHLSKDHEFIYISYENNTIEKRRAACSENRVLEKIQLDTKITHIHHDFGYLFVLSSFRMNQMVYTNQIYVVELESMFKIYSSGPMKQIFTTPTKKLVFPSSEDQLEICSMTSAGKLILSGVRGIKKTNKIISIDDKKTIYFHLEDKIYTMPLPDK